MFKLLSLSLVFFLVLLTSSVVLIYYGYMSYNGRGDEAKEVIFDTIRTNVRKVSDKIRSSVSSLSDIAMTRCGTASESSAVAS